MGLPELDPYLRFLSTCSQLAAHNSTTCCCSDAAPRVDRQCVKRRSWRIMDWGNVDFKGYHSHLKDDWI